MVGRLCISGIWHCLTGTGLQYKLLLVQRNGARAVTSHLVHSVNYMKSTGCMQIMQLELCQHDRANPDFNFTPVLLYETVH